jgi:Cys-tRNA(Pro)/Cys-tRNA(Cys) deacylase
MNTEEPNGFKSPVTQALDRLGANYRVFTHSGPVHSLEQAAQERGQHPEQVIRSILFRLPDDEFLMVLASGPKQIEWKALRKQIGTSRMTMANDEDLQKQTGYLPGSVSPFGIPGKVRLLVDRQILDQSEISVGSGVRGTTVIMSTKEFMKALGKVEIIELAKE